MGLKMCSFSFVICCFCLNKSLEYLGDPDLHERMWIFNQCCGSGSYVFCLRDPDPLERGLDPTPDPSVIKQK
jgi:hypothetical protein